MFLLQIYLILRQLYLKTKVYQRDGLRGAGNADLFLYMFPYKVINIHIGDGVVEHGHIKLFGIGRQFAHNRQILLCSCLAVFCKNGVDYVFFDIYPEPHCFEDFRD